jgi:hypothetical protein
VEPTVEELRAAVELPGDTMHYIKLATNRHGLPSWPKAQRGRKRPHMAKHAQAIKSTSLAIFRGLFTKHITELEAKAKAAGEVFNGVPNDDLPKLGAKASVLGAKQIQKKLAAARRQARNRQKLSRRINRGVVPGNTNVLAYITN